MVASIREGWEGGWVGGCLIPHRVLEINRFQEKEEAVRDEALCVSL